MLFFVSLYSMNDLFLPVYPAWRSLAPNFSTYERLKTFLASISLIAPLRFIIVWVLLGVGWVLVRCMPKTDSCKIESLGSRLLRQGIICLVRLGCRIILFISGFLYIWTKGQRDSRARILVSSHHSIWDALWFIWDCQASQTAKEELFHSPLIGPFLRATDSLPIDRVSREGRRSAFNSIKQRASQTGPPLVIFPTACCSNCRQLMSFKRGAFEPGVPIQPVGISYPSRHYDLTLTRWPLWDMYRTMCQFVNFMTVTYLPIQYPSMREKQEAGLWAVAVRNYMAQQLAMLPVEHTFETELVRIRCRDKGVVFNETKCRIVNLCLSLRVVNVFAELAKLNDGWARKSDLPADIQASFDRILCLVKLPDIPDCMYADACVNVDSWVERGLTGLITGGRLKLPQRARDAYDSNAIEVAEVITYFNKCLMDRSRLPDPSLVQLFQVSEFLTV